MNLNNIASWISQKNKTTLIYICEETIMKIRFLPQEFWQCMHRETARPGHAEKAVANDMCNTFATEFAGLMILLRAERKVSFGRFSVRNSPRDRDECLFERGKILWTRSSSESRSLLLIFRRFSLIPHLSLFSARSRFVSQRKYARVSTETFAKSHTDDFKDTWKHVVNAVKSWCFGRRCCRADLLTM